MHPSILVKKFIKTILEKEPWFFELVSSNNVDLILLAGSVARRHYDKCSDLDLFLICNRKVQKDYALSPMYEYDFNGLNIEISLVSTEKLINDTENKENLYWWHKCVPIKIYNRALSKVFKQASFITKREIRDRLWTNWVLFQIYSESILKLKARNETLSIRLLLNQNISLMIDSFLSVNDVFVSHKWQGMYLRDRNIKLYEEIIKMTRITNTHQLIDYNDKLGKELFDLLKDNGFEEAELLNWAHCNLDRLTFQYK